ncbi:MAG TPA: hypothetical protein VGU23_04920, partial [Acidobacteriaceae bacterium]|nr:hypothetical protein [Acidobacteriaceae bacterium]
MRVTKRIAFLLTSALFVAASQIAARQPANTASPAAAAPTPSFDVASIRQNITSTDGRHHMY